MYWHVLALTGTYWHILACTGTHWHFWLMDEEKGEKKFEIEENEGKEKRHRKKEQVA